VRRAVAALRGEKLLGLVDAAERSHFETHLTDVFACDPDLESEFIRALGIATADPVEGVGSCSNTHGVPLEGLEPPTVSLGRNCSSIELQRLADRA
jgi:hypothetical protein